MWKCTYIKPTYCHKVWKKKPFPNIKGFANLKFPAKKWFTFKLTVTKSLNRSTIIVNNTAFSCCSRSTIAENWGITSISIIVRSWWRVVVNIITGISRQPPVTTSSSRRNWYARGCCGCWRWSIQTSAAMVIGACP